MHFLFLCNLKLNFVVLQALNFKINVKLLMLFFKIILIILKVMFGLVGFYGIWTIVGYLMPNPVYIYMLNIYKFCEYIL